MKETVITLIRFWELGAMRFEWLLKWFAASVLFFLMVVTCIDVLGRYLFDSPLIGSVEITELLLGCLIFSAMPLITWRKEHIVVDLIDNLFPEGLKKVRDMFFDLCIGSSLAVIGMKVWGLADRAAGYEEVTEYLEIPVSYFIHFIAASCFLTSVTAFVLVITRLVDKEYENQE
ncbi:TRAP transporter small permease [Endozoicomonas sp. OPT23]|uniref:TRAP transporter small permease n=1 Tax=Endozoicomonas sp. OPT23 TaxID=2072845 RepID=UPI00129A296C|nr:TRAP transporter small permease [Endozoicomonas sp. OPT23]MRI33627.1 TRAP transporter small permease [Endozoicomonas sp. OPT23]